MSSPGTKVVSKDRQIIPFVMVPKTFFTRFKPSLKAIAVYIAIKFYANNSKGTAEYTSVPTMAATVDLSEKSFKRGLAELVKIGAIRVRRRSRKSSNGERIPLPNLYEVVNLEISSNDPI